MDEMEKRLNKEILKRFLPAYAICLYVFFWKAMLPMYAVLPACFREWGLLVGCGLLLYAILMSVFSLFLLCIPAAMIGGIINMLIWPLPWEVAEYARKEYERFDDIPL